MFLPREKKILQILFKNEKMFTTAEIAVELKVNPRTVKTDIKKINDELKKNSCFIRTKRGVGLWLDYDEAGEQFLQNTLYENRDSYISAEVRKYYIAAEILSRKGCSSMETLANQFYVSKATVLNDLNSLEEFWGKSGVLVIKKVKYGVTVEGTEKQLRLALFDAMKKVAVQSGGSVADSLGSLFRKVNLNQLGEVIQRTEKRFHFVLTDISFDEFLIRTAIIIERVAMGCLIEYTKGESAETREEWFVTQFLKEQIADYMNVELPEVETTWLLKGMKGLRFQVPMKKTNDKETVRGREPEMFDFMMEVLREVDEKYLLELEDDEELVCAMFTHLECMLYRIQGQMYLTNPILESVKREMFFEYEIASYLLAKFNVKYGVEAMDDEIGYVTFHIGTSIEKSAQVKRKKNSATIVCMTGFGTAQFISVKLKRLFPDLFIRRIISENMAKTLKPEEQDFVISTVPLKLKNIDVIQVSLVLNEEDTEKIQKYMERGTAAQEKEEGLYDCLKGFLHNEITILGCDLKTKEEAIRLLGDRMVTEGYVDDGFVDSAFEREKLSDTSMGSLIAIPHAFEGHILRQGIGLLTLKRPISWGKQQVQVVFMLALNTNTEIDDFRKIFKAIYNLTQNFKDVDRILKVESLGKLKKS